jgi:hypothetical protein
MTAGPRDWTGNFFMKKEMEPSRTEGGDALASSSGVMEFLIQAR